jgi:hypothetical protein
MAPIFQGNELLEQPFRFLSLPIELRLMIYERLSRTLKHHTLQSPPENDPVTFITRSIDLSIMRTCKTIYNEAHRVIRRVLRNFIESASPKLICTEGFPVDLLGGILRSLMYPDDPVPVLASCYKAYYVAGENSVSLWDSIKAKKLQKEFLRFITQGARQIRHAAQQSPAGPGPVVCFVMQHVDELSSEDQSYRRVDIVDWMRHVREWTLDQYGVDLAIAGFVDAGPTQVLRAEKIPVWWNGPLNEGDDSYFSTTRSFRLWIRRRGKGSGWNECESEDQIFDIF